MLTFSFKKIYLNVSSAKWLPFCIGVNVLTHWQWTNRAINEAEKKNFKYFLNEKYIYLCFHSNFVYFFIPKCQKDIVCFRECLAYHIEVWTKVANILQTTFSNVFCWMENVIFCLKFYWSLFLMVHLRLNQHWFCSWLVAWWHQAVNWMYSDPDPKGHMAFPGQNEFKKKDDEHCIIIWETMSWPREPKSPFNVKTIL